MFMALDRRLSPLLSVVLMGAAAGAFGTAQAQEVEPEYALAYNVGLLSDYRVRGIAQTSLDPAVQAGVDLTLKSGLYAGLFASNVKWVKDFNGATKGSVEVDVYGGYRGALDELGLSYDLGVITYQYPGNNSGVGGKLPAGTFGDANTVEVYSAFTYKIATLKYNRSVGGFLGNLNSSGSQYFDLSAGFDLTNGYLLTPHVGHQLVAGQPASNTGNYWDFALTLTKDMGNGVVFSLAGMKTHAHKPFYTDTLGNYLGKNALVAGVKYNF